MDQESADVFIGLPGRPHLAESEIYRGKNDARRDLMKNARLSRNVTKSLQPCLLKDNENVLTNLLQVEKIEKIRKNHVAQDRKEYDQSFLPFDEALALFFLYKGQSPPFNNTDKDAFQYALLHPKWGLCVYIVFVEILNSRFIVLRLDGFCLGVFLTMASCISEVPSVLTENRFKLSSENMKPIIQTVDTEWDSKVSRVLISAGKSRQEVSDLGIGADNINADIAKVHIHYQQSLLCAKSFLNFVTYFSPHSHSQYLVSYGTCLQHRALLQFQPLEKAIKSIQ